ncbi:hypothetical protein [Poriferisphaera sp. WC338]|uniref:hypothetical protein n=1 Tax=Poriferisphaera sp. WC338 TaxID=3425129 RepID=UPI003D818D95
MTKASATSLLLLFIAITLTACSTPPPPTIPGTNKTAANPFEIDQTEYARLFDAATTVLERNDYQLDRNDYRFGIITTKAQASPTVLEPWYAGKNATWDQVDASTLDQIQRFVTVRLTTGKLIKHDFLTRQKVFSAADASVLTPQAEITQYDLTIQEGPASGSNSGSSPENATPQSITPVQKSGTSTIPPSPSSPQAESAEDAFLRSHNITPPDQGEHVPSNPQLGKDAPSEQNALPALPDNTTPAHTQLPPELAKLNDNEYYLFVNVEMQRLVNTLRYLNGRAGSDVFATLNEVPIEWRRRGIPPVYWQTIGRDAYAEQQILAEIVRESFNN